jgi:hypothetical protein
VDLRQSMLPERSRTFRKHLVERGEVCYPLSPVFVFLHLTCRRINQASRFYRFLNVNSPETAGNGVFACIFLPSSMNIDILSSRLTISTTALTPRSQYVVFSPSLYVDIVA